MSSKANRPDAATTREELLMPIERRVQLRKAIVGARFRDKLVVLPPAELEELLDGYEHGRFRTNG